MNKELEQKEREFITQLQFDRKFVTISAITKIIRKELVAAFKNTLEARVIIYTKYFYPELNLDKEHIGFWKDLLIVSQCEINQADDNIIIENPMRDITYIPKEIEKIQFWRLPEFRFKIYKAEGLQCDRCQEYDISVKEDNNICDRCKDIINGND